MEAEKATEFICQNQDGDQFQIEVYLGPFIAQLCAAAKQNGGEASIHMGHIKAVQLKDRTSGKRNKTKK